jgi:hypothetical protein
MNMCFVFMRSEMPPPAVAWRMTKRPINTRPAGAATRPQFQDMECVLSYLKREV